MAIEDRRLRERTARRELILQTARTLAEAEGWEAVTTRRLSTEIEYSQPVIYKHFASLDDLVEAVALEGFGELAEALARARGEATPGEEMAAVARAYCAFAARSPALYDAMFVRATGLSFGAGDVPPPLLAGFAELLAAVETVAGERSAEMLTEVFWAALHGLITLERGRRIRPGAGADRIELLISQFRPPKAP